MTLRRASIAAFSAAAVLAFSGAAQAQSEGFALNRFDPSERGSEWFANESLDLRGHVRPVFGIVLDYAHEPLLEYESEGGDVSRKVVETQFFGHVGGGVTLWDRLRVAASLPVLFINSGETSDVPGAVNLTEDGAGVGDLRLGADVRLVGQYGDKFTMAFGVQGHLPTGSRAAFTSDEKVRLVPRLNAAGDIGALAYSVRLGTNIRFEDQTFDGDTVGTELGFGAAVGARVMDKKLLIGPELYGNSVVSDGDAFFGRRTTPVEVILGGHYTAGDWRFGAGVGPGLTRGFGTPTVRVLGNIEFYPEIVEKKEEPPPPADSDNDGIIDDEDACPNTPGVKTDDPKTNGCPAPGDKDGDGIIDEEDACPDTAGEPNEDPAKNGCPPPGDRDNDGIIDDKDACPDTPGEANDDPEKNGCPPPKDTDGDGILDPDDACPKTAGVANDDPKKHGCPKAKIVGKKIEILERIEFDTAKATIRPSSEGVLNAVLDILKKYPQIKMVSIEGHTDNKGRRYYNVGLSKRRAASVVKWLVKHGIDKKRLSSKGFGPDKPIDSNDTKEGRQNNRRVEFQIKKVDGDLTVKNEGKKVN